MGNNGVQVIIAATILGVCILGAGFLLSQSVDRASGQIPEFEQAMKSMQTAALAAARPAPAAKPAPKRRRGPDPNKVYKISTNGDPSRGPADAKVSIVEFSDFQCPFCARAGPTLAQVEKAYGDQVRIVYKQLPLAFHDKAEGAARASLAADRQGKFWEMHDLIFANQRTLSEAKYVEYAGELGLDVEKFRKDMASPETQKQIDDDKKEAARLGVTGTPSFFINGRFMSGAKPFNSFKTIIDEELGKT